jgi:hypothetical protein
MNARPLRADRVVNRDHIKACDISHSRGYPPALALGVETTMNKITAEMSLAEVLRITPGAREVFDRHGLKGCGGESGPSESISFFATVHGGDAVALLSELNQEKPDSRLP